MIDDQLAEIDTIIRNNIQENMVNVFFNKVLSVVNFTFFQYQTHKMYYHNIVERTYHTLVYSYIYCPLYHAMTTNKEVQRNTYDNLTKAILSIQHTLQEPKLQQRIQSHIINSRLACNLIFNVINNMHLSTIASTQRPMVYIVFVDAHITQLYPLSQ
eukprot:UN07593